MIRLTAVFLFSVSFLLPLLSHGQDEPGGGVTVHADPRLSLLMIKHAVKTAEPAPPKVAEKTEHDTTADNVTNTSVVTRAPVVRYSGEGFRVQVYSGPDRAKAIAVKNDLMRRFPGIHTYLTFVAPSFRVKIGDYRTRAQAENMLKQANTVYNPCMIVPDEITITGYQ